ncbi:MAG: hypothetical protein K2Y27_26390 [Xanthobacteraceae bacterium]|nr:hypothetical protein [Xanthobacteraceae bacterium]
MAPPYVPTVDCDEKAIDAARASLDGFDLEVWEADRVVVRLSKDSEQAAAIVCNNPESNDLAMLHSDRLALALRHVASGRAILERQRKLVAEKKLKDMTRQHPKICWIALSAHRRSLRKTQPRSSRPIGRLSRLPYLLRRRTGR